MTDKVAGPDGSALSKGLGPLPEPRMWYDHATQRCSGMAPVGGTNERLWDASDMRAYAAAAVAAERERCAVVGGAAADAGKDGAGVAAAIRGA